MRCCDIDIVRNFRSHYTATNLCIVRLGVVEIKPGCGGSAC